MEGLHQVGLKRKTILVKFLKEKKILGDFIGNFMIENKRYKEGIDTNYIFNNYSLKDMFYCFFHIRGYSYPKNIKGFLGKIMFWSKINNEWETFLNNQKYIEKYNIW